MDKDYFSISDFSEQFVLKDEYKISERKRQELEEYAVEENKKMFLWRYNADTNKIIIYPYDYGCSKECETLINSNEMIIMKKEFQVFQSINGKLKESDSVAKEELKIFERTDTVTRKKYDVFIEARYADKTKTDIEGIGKILKYKCELDTYKEKVYKYTHDVKNQITVMLAAANSIEKNAKDDNLKKQAYLIKDAILNCDYMLSIFREDSKDQNKNRLFNMHYILNLILDSLHFEDKIELEQQFKASNPRIYGDKVLIINAIYNVIINSVQALEHKGKIKLKTYNKNLLSESKASEWLFIEIEDNGNGIKKENLNKIFNPYYTTKSNGNGIGLYSAKETIEQHKGTITCRIYENKGTVFTIRLPSYIE